MKNHRINLVRLLVGLLVSSFWCSPAFSKTEAFVSFTYGMPPPTKPLPQELQTIALLPPEALATISGQRIDWDRIVRGSLRRQLELYHDQHARQLQIHDRDDMKLLDDETQRLQAGTLAGSDDTRELLQPAAEMYIRSRITCSITRVQGHKQKLDLGSTLRGWYYWHWWHVPHVQERTVHEVAMNVSVECDFELLVAGQGGQSFHTYSKSLTNHEKTKASIFLGIGSRSEADLTPVEQIIQQLVDQHILAFLSPVIPMKATEVAYVSTKHKGSRRAAINALSAENWDEAFSLASEAHRKHAGWSKAPFIMGIACEKLGKFPIALAWYERAQRLGHDLQYAQGIARIRRRLAHHEPEQTVQPTPPSTPDSPPVQAAPAVESNPNSGVVPNPDVADPPVHISTPVSHELAAALRAAAQTGSKNQTEARRMEQIVAEALREWVRHHPGSTSKEKE